MTGVDSYVFADSSRLLCSIFIHNLTKLLDKRINSNVSFLFSCLSISISHCTKQGILKMQRNLFAIQQNLAHMLTKSQDALFDRTRVFVDLLGKTEEELGLFTRDNATMFSIDEIRVLKQVTIASKQVLKK